MGFDLGVSAMVSDHLGNAVQFAHLRVSVAQFFGADSTCAFHGVGASHANGLSRYPECGVTLTPVRCRRERFTPFARS